ncbi:MAG: GtrA family protein [Oscillospiraceae bacterium]|nr:GtrA family protein [Oscillospiraceae bacterium]
MNAIKRFKAKRPELYEFIMFNILANIATITNFAVLNISRSLIFGSFKDTPFSFWLFDYSVENGGLAGFLSFLLGYGCAQTVNFIVQRKLVFGSKNRLSLSIVIYIFFVILVYMICLYVPTLVLGPLTGWVGGFWAANIANVLNILIQVVIMYPVLKFIVMKKGPASEQAAGGECG